VYLIKAISETRRVY